MGRFRVIKSKGQFYVVAGDTNSLAGGPYQSPDDAAMHSDKLNVLEAQQALAAKQPEAHRMAIAPGYRSPNVEDFRALGGMTFMPPGFQTANGRPGTGTAPPWIRHHIPVDPADLLPASQGDPEMKMPPPAPVGALGGSWIPQWTGGSSLGPSPAKKKTP